MITKMVYQFLTPPSKGRRFKTIHKGVSKTWKVVEVVRKMSNVGHRYEIKAELINVSE